MSVCNVLKSCASVWCVSLAAFGLCVTIYVRCCCGAESPVTLSRFLMFHRCGLSAECIVDFSLWFFGSLSSVTNPVGQAIVAQPRRAFSWSLQLQKLPLCTWDTLGGGSSTLNCFLGFLIIIIRFLTWLITISNGHLLFLWLILE